MMERAGQSTEGMIIPLGENDLSSTEPSIASGASTPSLPASPVLAAAIPDGPPEKGPAPAMSGAAPTVESTMAAKPAAANATAAKPTAANSTTAKPTAANATTAKPAAAKPAVAMPKIVPAVPHIPLLGNTANRQKTAKGGAPKT